MKTELIDDLQFLLVTPAEHNHLEKTWTDEEGGTVEDVGDGIFLFQTNSDTVFRTRVDQTN